MMIPNVLPLRRESIRRRGKKRKEKELRSSRIFSPQKHDEFDDENGV